jgi:2-dehydropantoate 2-reductase
MLALAGAGSLGQTFAAALALSGQPVTLLATPGTAARLREAGRVRVHGALEGEIPVGKVGSPAGTIGLTDDPAELPRGAGLLFTTKGHQLPAAARAVRAAWPTRDDADAWVGGVQNGIVKDDVLAELFGAERVVGAVTIVGAQREPDGRVACTSRGSTYLGEFDRPTSPRAEAAVEALNRAGLPTTLSPDIRSVLWSKMCNATGVFGVQSLSRISSTRYGHYPELIRAYMGLIRETAAIANALGVSLGDYAGFPIKTFLERTDDEQVAVITANAAPFDPTATESRSSMLQDLLAGRPLEVDQIFADVVARAERVGVPVPRLEIVRDLVRAIDPGRVERPTGER